MKLLSALVICLFSRITYSQQVDKTVYVFKKEEPVTLPQINSSIRPVIDSVAASALFILMPSPHTSSGAMEQLTNGNLTIVISAGFQGFPKENKKLSETFRKKYNVHFKYIGCIRRYDPTNEDIHGYNKIMKDYLLKKFGQKCLNEFNAIFS